MANKKSNGKNSTKKTTREVTVKVEWILLVFVGLLFLISLFTQGFTSLPFNLKVPFVENILGTKSVSPEKAKEIALKYINEDVLQGQFEAQITEIVEDEEDNNLYRIKLDIAGQEYESFVSKDGKYLYFERQEITVSDEEVADYPKQDNPQVLLFTMSYCPFGNQAEDFVKPVNDLLGSTASIEPHYVIYNKSYGYEGEEFCLDKESQYCSMHGVQELNQDVRELCTFKYQKDKYWDFVLAANEKCTSDNVDKCWEGVAKDLGMNLDQIKSCQADEAYDLLAEEVRLNEQYEVTGSPTIIINGKDFTGSRTPEAFKQAVCASYSSQPGECEQQLDDSENTSEGSCN